MRRLAFWSRLSASFSSAKSQNGGPGSFTEPPPFSLSSLHPSLLGVILHRDLAKRDFAKSLKFVELLGRAVST